MDMGKGKKETNKLGNGMTGSGSTLEGMKRKMTTFMDPLFSKKTPSVDGGTRSANGPNANITSGRSDV
jgi:hypothetical protein